MAVNLTTVDKFKAFKKITVATDDALFLTLIEAVSQQIAEFCDRVFEQTTYREYLDGSGTEMMLLTNFPVTRVFRAANVLEDVADIQFEGSDEVATVDFDGTNLRLFSVDVTGTEIDTAINVTTVGKVLSTLKTAVDAVSGWSMDIEAGQDARPSANIKPLFGAWAKKEDRARIEMPLDGVAIELVENTDRAVQVQRASTIFFAFGNGIRFPAGKRNIFFHYQAGFILPQDAGPVAGTVPEGLTLVTNQIVDDVFSMSKQDTSLKSESLADHRVGLNADTISSAVTNRSDSLLPYCKITI